MPPPPLSQKRLAPGVKIDLGRYELLKKLGEGGGGVVWLALHVKMNANVAIKFPRQEAKETESRFEQEIMVHVELSNRHPHYVSIIDVGRHGQLLYVVMQYLANGCLADRIKARKQSDLSNASVNWMKAIGDALDFLHDNGMVHRDVKPANILLDDSMSAYLADFGIAKVLTKTSRIDRIKPAKVLSVPGSLPYLAPELLRNTEATPLSDQFAFAVSIYEYLTGSRPYEAVSAESLFEEHKSGKIPSITNRRRRFPSEVQSILFRALSDDPANRYACCSELASELLEYSSVIETIHATQAPPRVRPPLPTTSTTSSQENQSSRSSLRPPTSEIVEAGGANTGQHHKADKKIIRASRLNRPRD